MLYEILECNETRIRFRVSSDSSIWRVELFTNGVSRGFWTNPQGTEKTYNFLDGHIVDGLNEIKLRCLNSSQSEIAGSVTIKYLIKGLDENSTLSEIITENENIKDSISNIITILKNNLANKGISSTSDTLTENVNMINSISTNPIPEYSTYADLPIISLDGSSQIIESKQKVHNYTSYHYWGIDNKGVIYAKTDKSTIKAFNSNMRELWSSIGSVNTTIEQIYTRPDLEGCFICHSYNRSVEAPIQRFDSNGNILFTDGKSNRESSHITAGKNEYTYFLDAYFIRRLSNDSLIVTFYASGHDGIYNILGNNETRNKYYGIRAGSLAETYYAVYNNEYSRETYIRADGVAFNGYIYVIDNRVLKKYEESSTVGNNMERLISHTNLNTYYKLVVDNKNNRLLAIDDDNVYEVDTNNLTLNKINTPVDGYKYPKIYSSSDTINYFSNSKFEIEQKKYRVNITV